MAAAGWPARDSVPGERWLSNSRQLRAGRRARRTQVDLVYLADQVDAEAMMRLRLDQLEPAGQVDTASGGERVVGPQLHARVASRAGELQALVNEPGAELAPARGGVDEQDPQLSGGLVGGNAEHASH